MCCQEQKCAASQCFNSFRIIPLITGLVGLNLWDSSWDPFDLSCCHKKVTTNIMVLVTVTKRKYLTRYKQCIKCKWIELNHAGTYIIYMQGYVLLELYWNGCDTTRRTLFGEPMGHSRLLQRPLLCIIIPRRVYDRRKRWRAPLVTSSHWLASVSKYSVHRHADEYAPHGTRQYPRPAVNWKQAGSPANRQNRPLRLSLAGVS